MAVPYNHKVIEKKWRKQWEEHPINVNDGKKDKYYCLDMFPYPSGNGLHVGHWRGYVISDVWSRYKLMHGYYVIHPMGWDAFGLPAENYAIKTGSHPAESTAKNIANIKRQINEIAAIYDWDMEVNTTDPSINGHSGFLSRCLKKVLLTKKKCQLTGAHLVKQDLQTKKLLVANVNVVAQM